MASWTGEGLRTGATRGLAGVAVLVMLCVPFAVGGDQMVVLVVALGTVAVAVATTGWAVRRGRRDRRRYEARLTRLAAQRAAQAERLRLARDLHDLVSHNLALVTVRATSALHLRDPAGERTALRDIERIGRESVAELRQLLAVLRQPSDGADPIRPVDSFDVLPAIVAESRALGLDVTLHRPADLQVPAGAQLVACRVVREGLANVARHAGPTGAEVELAAVDGGITVTVRDRGPGPGWQPQPGTRHGLTSLREQVEAVGGRLTTRPVGGGFELAVRLPSDG